MSIRAFVLEDQATIRESLVEALAELASVQTVGFADAEKPAIEWLTDPSNEWDLAILDLNLGTRGNGFGVLRACRGRLPGRKVVVLTATANPEVRKECESLGSDRVFDKSMETEALVEWCADLGKCVETKQDRL